MIRDRADLHLHTTCSDGLYSPAEIVDLAARSGLAAIAITDHDTLEGFEPARAAAPADLEVIPAVEVTAHFHESELHLLGYFVDPDDANLKAVFAMIRDRRIERFRTLVERCRALGLSIGEEEVKRQIATGVAGRRQLAQLLVHAGHAGTLQEAFDRWLGDGGRVSAPLAGLPVAEAIAAIRGAGGVAVMAHPSYDGTRKNILELVRLGLQGLEANYPGCPPNRVRQLRELALELGLVVSGGSDCHGPGSRWHAVGACTATRTELDKLRGLAQTGS